MWGQRLPAVVSSVGKKGVEQVSVKLEVVSGVVVASLVKEAATFLGVRREVELAVRGRGARVSRPVGRGNPSVVGCFSCWDRGHVEHFCPREGAVSVMNGHAGRCWECGGEDHHIAECLGRSLPVAGADGFSSRRFLGVV